MRKNYLRKKLKNLLIMQFATHSNCCNIMNAIDTTLISSQNVSETFFKSFTQIQSKLNTKINMINNYHKTKKNNASKTIS